MTKFVGSNDVLNTEDNSLLLQDGFYEPEIDIAWSGPNSSLRCKGTFSIYIYADVEDVTVYRKVTYSYKGISHSLALDRYSEYEIAINSDVADEIIFKADGYFCPNIYNHELKDDRKLSFRISTNKKHVGELSLKPTAFSPERIIFIADAKKEIDALLPIFQHLRENKWLVDFCSVSAAIETLDAHARNIFAIASPEMHNVLHAHFKNSRYIFLEHGIGYTKQYSYSAHYNRYDLLLLPGQVFASRIQYLYPNTFSKCKVIGFPKLKSVDSSSLGNQARWLSENGLNPNLPLVLFAPTWSAGNSNTGIFNIKRLNINANLVGVPHNADDCYATELIDLGFNIHVLQGGKTISEYYQYTDILISDTSSTALEFAALGGKSITWVTEEVNDLEKKYVEDDQIKIPFTDQYWNFYKSTNSAGINQLLAKEIAKIDPTNERSLSLEIAMNVQHLIHAYGRHACLNAEKAIDDFLRFGQK
jgi:hypothetical protein